MVIQPKAFDAATFNRSEAGGAMFMADALESGAAGQSAYLPTPEPLASKAYLPNHLNND